MDLLRGINSKSELTLLWQVKSQILLPIYKILEKQFIPFRHPQDLGGAGRCQPYFSQAKNPCLDLHVLPERVYFSGVARQSWRVVDFIHSIKYFLYLKASLPTKPGKNETNFIHLYRHHPSVYFWHSTFAGPSPSHLREHKQVARSPQNTELKEARSWNIKIFCDFSKEKAKCWMV